MNRSSSGEVWHYFDSFVGQLYYPALMSNQLPKRVNYIALAKSGTKIQVKVPVAQFTRFSELLVNTQGWVEVNVQFGRDSAGFHTLTGELSAEVSLICQRCLNSMSTQIRAPVRFALLPSEGLATRVAESFDIEIAETGVIDLHEMLENELILFVPIAPMHEEECELPIEGAQPVEVSMEDSEEFSNKPNPFVKLASLKQKLSKKE